MRHLPLTVFAVVLTACQTLVPPEQIRSEVGLAAQNWANAFNNCDSQKLAALYAPDAVLWGTVSPAIISSPAGIRQYFDRACSAAPSPKVAFGEQLVRVHGEAANNSGGYVFTVFPGGQARQFPARYSFSYKKQNGQWLITDHHSSAVPSQPTSAPAPARQ